MSKTKFTKGEWKLYGKNNMMVVNDKTLIVAECKGSNVLPDEEKQANAKLISVSPRMYFLIDKMFEELEYQYSKFNLKKGNIFSEISKEIKEIKKATL